MTHRAVVTREDGAWLASVENCDGAHTWSPNGLAKLDQYVRDAVALMDDLADAEQGLDVEWVFAVTDDDLADAVAEVRGVSRAEVLATGWSLADVAHAVNAPVERVTHVPPHDAAHVAQA